MTSDRIALDVMMRLDDCGVYGWIAKGHHDMRAFAEAVGRETGEAAAAIAPHCRQTHARWIPLRDNVVADYRFHECGPGRGAFACTVLLYGEVPDA